MLASSRHSLLLLLLSWTLPTHCMPATILQNPSNLPISSRVASTTDELCDIFYSPFTDEKNKGRDLSKQDRIVISYQAKVNLPTNSVTFYCQDARESLAVQTVNWRAGRVVEVQSSGAHTLTCDLEHERPALVKLARKSRRDKPVRWGGRCRAKTETEKYWSKELRTEARAGTTACMSIQAPSEHAAAVNAWTESTRQSSAAGAGAGAGVSGVNALEFAQELSLSVVGTSKSITRRDAKVLSMAVDSTTSRVYRACAKLPPGSGNGYLRMALATISV